MTGRFVLDASAAIACAMPDEAPPAQIRRAVIAQAIVVPALWPFEVENVLWMLRRRGRLNEAAYDLARTLIEGLNVTIEPPDRLLIQTSVAELAVQHQLTIYDASYLELARRLRLPLATLDGELRRAARAARIKLV